MNRLVWSLSVAAALLANRVAAQTPATAFQIGDRILLHVEGDSALSDTFTVVAGPAPRPPALGGSSFAGGRRSDLRAHLTPRPGRDNKEPLGKARAPVRI